MNLHNARFIISAAGEQDFPRDGLPQVAFIGKSNAGKSSVINCLLGRRDLSRTGSQPGKTRHINFFKIDDRIYFVDLPGYGYAKVSDSEKKRWGQLLEIYFNKYQLISCGVLIVDIRRKPSQDDLLICDWFLKMGRPLMIAANKCDKLSKNELAVRVPELSCEFPLDEGGDIIPFSASKGIGRDILLSKILKNIR